MSDFDPDRLHEAHRLRRKAARYRDLARSNGDARDVKIIETTCRELDEEAARLEEASVPSE